MNLHYPVREETATPEYILALLVGDHRLRVGLDPEADSDTKLSFETTVAEWRAACDLVGWKKLWPGLNTLFGTTLSEGQWQEILEPADTKTLRGLCEFLAKHVKRWRVIPARLAGRECFPAGAFLTVRSILAEAGLDTERIKPSTSLASLLRADPEVLTWKLGRVAAGILPPATIEIPVYSKSVVRTILACWLGLVCLASFQFGLVVGWLALIGGGWTICHFLRSRVLVVCFRRAGLHTFADLSRFISTGCRQPMGREAAP